MLTIIIIEKKKCYVTQDDCTLSSYDLNILNADAKH